MKIEIKIIADSPTEAQNILARLNAPSDTACKAPEVVEVATPAKKVAKKKVEPTPDPEVEPIVEPTPDPEVEPIVEPTPEPTPETAKPKHTADSVTEVAKLLISKSFPATLRALLDAVVGVGVKIGDAPASTYDAMHSAITAKIAEVSK